jgi:hypothetical protein
MGGDGGWEDGGGREGVSGGENVFWRKKRKIVIVMYLRDKLDVCHIPSYSFSSIVSNILQLLPSSTPFQRLNFNTQFHFPPLHAFFLIT